MEYAEKKPECEYISTYKNTLSKHTHLHTNTATRSWYF